VTELFRLPHGSLVTSAIRLVHISCTGQVHILALTTATSRLPTSASLHRTLTTSFFLSRSRSIRLAGQHVSRPRPCEATACAVHVHGIKKMPCACLHAAVDTGLHRCCVVVVGQHPCIRLVAWGCMDSLFLFLLRCGCGCACNQSVHLQRISMVRASVYTHAAPFK
jgi:hypothetical protein